MGWAEFVVAIVAITTLGGILRARYGVGRDQQGNEFRFHDDSGVRAENVQLKDEVARMKERLAVLERVITDNHSSSDLDREIEKLRDK